MKKVLVIKNGERAYMTYADICHELGFDPDSRFIKIWRGLVGWTAGKRYEILALKKACMDRGYKPSKALREF